MRSFAWLSVFCSAAAWAGSVGVVEYQTNLAERDHAAVLNLKNGQVCYNVCKHDDTVSLDKCKVYSFCVPKTDFDEKLGVSQTPATELADRLRKQQQAIEQFRTQVERNRQSGGSFAGTPDQQRSAATRLKTAQDEAEKLQAQLTQSKQGPDYKTYREIVDTLANSDDSDGEPDFFIEKNQNPEAWKKVVAPFLDARNKQICYLAHTPARGCFLHLNQTVLLADRTLDKDRCKTSEPKSLISKFKSTGADSLATVLNRQCRNHYELKDMTVAFAGGARPLQSRDADDDDLWHQRLEPDWEVDRDRKPTVLPPSSTRSASSATTPYRPSNTAPPVSLRTTPPAPTQLKYSVTPLSSTPPKKDPPKRTGCAGDR